MSFGDGILITLGPFFSNTGVLYSQPKLLHYATGGTTLKDVYSDAAKTTPLAQPFVGTDTGQIVVYIDADDDYHLVVTSNDTITTLFDEDPVRLSRGNPHQGIEDFGTTAPSTPTANNLNHTFLQVDADGEIVDFLGCGDTDDPEYVSILSAILAAGGVDNLLTKFPVANIAHPDFGALIDDSTDDSAAVQSAASSLTTGGILLHPPGTAQYHGVDLLDNTIVVVLGTAKIPAGESGTYIFKSLNKENINYMVATLDGNDQGGSNALIIAQKTSGTKNNLTVGKVMFQNQAATETSLRVLGASGFEYEGVNVDNCRFLDVARGMSIAYSKGGNYTKNKMKTLSDDGIFMTESDENDVSGNWISGYGSIGIHCNNSEDNILNRNRMNGSESNSIVEDGSSDHNVITSNNVRGGHTNDIVVSGASSVVHSNPGSAQFQNGQIIGSGATGIDSYNYKLYDTESISNDSVNPGELKDTDNTFNDVTAEDNLTASGYCVVHFPNLTKYKWVMFAVRSIDSINELQLGASDNWDSAITFTTDISEGIYDIYPNFFDDADWESIAFGTADMTTATGAGNGDSDTVAGIVSEKEFLRLVFRANAGDSTDADVYIWTWKDGLGGIDSADTYQVLDAIDTTGTGTLLGEVFIFTDQLQNDLEIRTVNQDAGNAAKVTCDVYRLKRDVDE